jgi:hypothetical protein
VATPPRTTLFPTLVVSIMETVLDKGKPAARRGRKATGLPKEEVAGSPKGGAGENILLFLRSSGR